MKRTISTLMMVSAALVVGIAFMPPDAVAKKPSPNVTVNCDAGESIQAALNKASQSVPLTVTVAGSCEEDITIRRDDVSVNGNDNATIDGTIYVFDSNRITLSSITITGQGQGIQGFGSNISLYGVTVAENQDFGIQVFHSKVVLHDSSVAANQNGIQAGHGSALNAVESDISNNAGTGIYVDLNSILELNENSVVNNNSGYGVSLALNSSAFIWNGASIQGNGGGVAADMNSVVDLRNADISNNDTYGISVARDSAARLQAGAVINGNGVAGIHCHDTESSYANEGGTIADPINCTDFNE